MQVDKLDDVFGLSKSLLALEDNAAHWKRKMIATRTLRKKYETSGFANLALKQQEQDFKHLWWISLDVLKKFKNEMGLL